MTSRRLLLNLAGLWPATVLAACAQRAPGGAPAPAPAPAPSKLIRQLVLLPTSGQSFAARWNDAPELRQALRVLDFDPRAELDRRLPPALAQRGVALARLPAAEAGEQVRVGNVALLPPGTDAVLDVSVVQAGYYGSMRAGGYSPMLSLTTRVLAVVDGQAELARQHYYADWRETRRVRRWVTTPAALTVKSPESLLAAAPEARSALAGVVDRMVGLIAEDVARLAAGQPALDD